jgi:DNA-binding winged helix-turn-helix (wHTH) protein/tetratricopeptide (TPR) repeat protein/TolB-like protein
MRPSKQPHKTSSSLFLRSPRITFGPFVIADSGRVLLRSNEIVPVSPKVLATLTVLAEANGRVLSKTELLDAVWPDTFVEEANLTQNISVLRKLLALDYADRSPIETIAKVGYRFREVVSFEDLIETPASLLPEPPTTEPVGLFGWLGQRRRFAVTALLLLAIGSLTASGVVFYRRVLAGARLAHPRIAVLAFKNLSGSPEAAWLSSALRETLATDLNSDPDLRIVPNENVERAEQELNLTRTDGLSRDTLNRIADNLDCDEVVSGSYLITGGRVRLDTHLLDARSGAILGNYTATKSADEILPLINETSSVMRTTFGLRSGTKGDEAIPATVQATVSSNPEAYELYIKGLGKIRDYDGRAAVDLLEKAVALDPQFPLAHLQLSNALTILGQEARASEEAHKAEALSGSLSREQQLQIKGRAESTDHHFDDAAATYRSLATFYPDNVSYVTLLAAELSYGGHIQQSLDALKPILARNTPEAHDPRIYSTLSDIYSLTGDWPASLTWATKGAEESQRRGAKVLYGRLLTSETQSLFYMHQLQPALSKTQEALTIARSFSDYSGELRALNRLGQIETAMGKLPEAQAALDEALAREEQIGETQRQIHTLSALGSNLDKQNDRGGAMAMFNRELALAHSFNEQQFIVQAELDIGRQQVEMGNLAEGRLNLRKAADEAARLGDKELGAQSRQALATKPL